MASLPFFNLALMLLLLLAASTSSVAQSVQLQPQPGCQRQCGDIKVVWPFGIGKGCGRSEQFEFPCKKNDRGRLKPFVTGNNLGYDLEVSSISVSGGLARIKNPVSKVCVDTTDRSINFNFAGANLTQTPFWLSNTRNKFVVIGSNISAYIRLNRTTTQSIKVGCVARKWSKERVANGSCSGIGCCEATVPYFQSKNYIILSDLISFSNISNYDTCGYAVLTEASRFKFSTSYLTEPGSFEKDIINLSVALDWTIGSEKCKLARRNMSSYACVSSHSACIDYHDLGYRCNCAPGYQGNPYLLNGCRHTKDLQRYSYRKTCMDGSTMTNTSSSRHVVPKLSAGSEFDDNSSCNEQLCVETCFTSCYASPSLCRKCYFETPSCCCKK
ncbi:Wall-associated receptor kinase 2 [Rhynchospora pubera]|uniref:Wall-associated receptor kinase 2 n=1 Tax=Rhynchospora pubera TaxID=906938 RepID=A0AAV8GUU4_9POAL|nr:Wall-associated receptor kinase 2 [Rhynchospora pubera]